MKWLFAIIVVVSLNAQSSTTENLMKLLEGYQKFSAEFEQISIDQDGIKKSQLVGELAIAGTDIFYWRTEAPFAQIIVADGEVLWVYDEDLFQVQVRPLDTTLDASPASIFGGNALELSQKFDVKSNETETGTLYALTPYAEDDVVQQIVLRFDDKSLTGLDFEDVLGNRTRIILTSINKSAPNSSYFEFTPPKGADVIYALGD